MGSKRDNEESLSATDCRNSKAGGVVSVALTSMLAVSATGYPENGLANGCVVSERIRILQEAVETGLVTLHSLKTDSRTASSSNNSKKDEREKVAWMDFTSPSR